MPVIKGAGTDLKIGSGGESETFTAVAQVLSVTLPNRSRPTEKSTTLDDTCETYESGIPDGGKLKGTLKYHPTTHAALLTAFAGGLNKNWQIVHATTPAITGSVTGILDTLTPSAVDPRTAFVTCDFEIQCSSLYTEVVAS